MYEVFHVTVHGAGHIKKGQPCEDSSITLEDEVCKIFVVADGHGDSNCPRSKTGSEYICRIASEELKSFAGTIREQEWEQKLFSPRSKEQLVRQLIASIIGKWKMAVNEEFRQNPLTAEERSNCAKYISQYDAGKRIEHIYGTTMIAGLLTDKYLLLLQQGDGRCDVFDQQGSVSQPIPWDDRCFSNVTTSLCDTDAIPSCRYEVVDVQEHPVAACMAGSDGVEDSFFSMDLVHSYYRDLLKYAVEHSVTELRDYLEEVLPEFSANGSNDDTSIGGFIDVDLVRSLLPRFERDNQIVEAESSLKQLDDRILSMENGKMQFLEKKCKQAYDEFMKAGGALFQAEDVHPGENSSGINSSDSKYEEKKKKFEDAVKEKEEYSSRYEKYKAERENVKLRMEMLARGDVLVDEVTVEAEPEKVKVEAEQEKLEVEPETVKPEAEQQKLETVQAKSEPQEELDKPEIEQAKPEHDQPEPVTYMPEHSQKKVNVQPWIAPQLGIKDFSQRANKIMKKLFGDEDE